MMRLLFLITLLWSSLSWSQSSMRRCTLLPITDSVGGAIGFKVFEDLEVYLKQSNWCTYVSNSGLINVFSRYRENLAQYLKTKEVLVTVADRLKVGSLVRVAIISEIKGVEIQIDVYGENGEDLYFSERTTIAKDDIEIISNTVRGWLEMYSKTIPYDAQVNGVLGEQLTLDVGKGYPIQIGQKFTIKRPQGKKKHPLLKKIVDWETETMAEGTVMSISDNQAMGLVKFYKVDKKLLAGDWVRLEDQKQDVINDPTLGEQDPEKLGTLGILSLGFFGSSSSVDTVTPSGSNRMTGSLYGVDLRAEGWITRQYFAALEVERTIGTLKKRSGNPAETSVSADYGTYRVSGGYKYLPIGYFYGPQVDLYAGYTKHTFDLDFSQADGFGQTSINGIFFGTSANIPLNREYRFFGRVDFIPFPTFNDDDGIYGTAKSVSSLDFELGVKYQYTNRITIDGSIDFISRKAKFSNSFKEIAYMDTRLKLGASFNF